MEKYKEVLTWIHENWENKDAHYNGLDKDFLEACYWGVNNSYLSGEIVHILLDGNGNPFHCHFTEGYPLTPYGQEYIKPDTQKSIEKVKDGALSEIGKKSVAGIWWLITIVAAYIGGLITLWIWSH